MLPATHALTGYLLGRAVGRAGGLPAPRNPLRDPLVLAAVAGSLFPDWDVLPGLLGGSLLTVFHRGPTHSLLGILPQGLALAAALAWSAQRFFGVSLPGRSLFAAASLGVASHVFWDAFNRWGVRLAWPFLEAQISANLLHEGDLWVLGVVLLGSLVVWAGSFRAGVLAVCVLTAAYMGWQADWQRRLAAEAERRLAGQRFAMHPHPEPLTCWLVAAESERAFAAYTPSALGGSGLRRVFAVEKIRHPAIEASKAPEEVQLYRQMREFEFAELQRATGGGHLVIWRDLIDAVLRQDPGEPYGLYVRVGPGGEILSVRERWMLRLWF